jgi:tripartite-type tricarboxylate transporter receptor subunit TctC
MRRLALAAAAAAALLLAPRAEAAWPKDKQIEILLAFAAGGGTDVMARTLAPFLEKYLDATVIVTNKPGAGGELGFTALAQAKPDGYTIGFINTPNVLSVPIERKARYAFEDFQPIANMVDDPSAFNVNADSPFKALKDLVAYAKENPGKVTVGTTGVGSDDHLSMLYMERLAGIKLTHVPFSGSAPTRTALLGNHIVVGAVNVGEVASFTGDAGRIRTLGQMGEKRWEGMPNVPTFREQGYDVLMSSQRGLAAPKGLPKDILDRFMQAVQKTIDDPDFQAKAKAQFLVLAYEPADSWTASLKRQKEALEALWKTDPWAQK